MEMSYIFSTEDWLNKLIQVAKKYNKKHLDCLPVWAIRNKAEHVYVDFQASLVST